MGFHTVAIGRGGDKQALAKKLGAHDYIDTSAGSPSEALQKMGGANVILATAPDPKSCRLGRRPGTKGTLMVVGAGMESLTMTPLQLIGGSKSVHGWASDRPRFTRYARVQCIQRSRPMIERYPLEKAAEAYDQMISGRSRFRVVLTIGN